MPIAPGTGTCMGTCCCNASGEIGTGIGLGARPPPPRSPPAMAPIGPGIADAIVPATFPRKEKNPGSPCALVNPLWYGTDLPLHLPPFLAERV